MKNKPGLKLPKRLREVTPSQPTSQPQTVEDWVEQGASEEESGDRWIGSDLTKGLRFFQKAYVSYNEAIRAISGGSSFSSSTVDAYYNISRLLFHVYNNYIKQEGVNVYSFENVNEAIIGDNAVIQPLHKIVKAHEKAVNYIESTGGTIPLDLVYNIALVYTEEIETAQENEIPFERVLEIGLNAERLFESLLTQQTAILQKFIVDLSQGDEVEDVETSSTDGNDTQFESEESLQPPDIYETILSSYRLVQSILENVTHPEQVSQVRTLIEEFLQSVNSIERELIQSFGEGNNQNSLIESIPQDLIHESKIIKTFIEGLLVNDLNALVQLWEGNGEDALPSIPETYMSFADNIQSFLDRNDINLDNLSTSEVYWNALTKMNNSYKSAQELLQIKLSSLKGQGVDGIGALAAQISDIIIARSDIDLQRSQITNYDPAIKHQQVLLNNAKTFLKSAVNVANQSGGLRERATEKMLREKRKVDAVLRLCLIENKITVTELDNIIGRSRWANELPNLMRTGYFKRFGIESIEIPSAF
ncbi:hypothetical protein CLIB1423_06S00804 [[Candida] railenensis]|uniref:Uncharacterized protein n=1 Tax=[Candida] railenensis TaxID=45579 RepID=A0A9P0VXS0_9ASCO|nr:hypothetical protein CLIB1423_06S00804 [[Candida] railenensis]